MFFINLLSSGIRIMTPYLLGGLGGIFSVRAGINIVCIEGMMLVGSFTGFYGAFVTGSPWIGILFACGSGVLTGLLHAFMSVHVGTNQVVSGTVINLGAAGLTSFLFSLVFGEFTVIQINKLPVLPIPGLSNIPILGEMLFQNSLLMYIAFLMVPLAWWFLYRTPMGLNVRAVGENPAAADSLGIPVYRIRYLCCITAGILASVGGAFITLEMVPVFMDGITSGKGFIAMAAMVLGRRHPFGLVCSCLIFGVAEALQFRMQMYDMINIPIEFLQMLPYVAAVLAMVLAVGKTRPPAAVGKPYFKE